MAPVSLPRRAERALDGVLGDIEAAVYVPRIPEARATVWHLMRELLDT